MRSPSRCGSCLPKDARALTYLARQLDVEVPILSNILPSNRNQIERAINKVVGFGQRDIAVLGFSFKPGTDDLRESPQVELIERLIGKGYNLKLYDPSVNLSALTGVNRQYIEKAIPHIGSIMMTSLYWSRHNPPTGTRCPVLKVPPGPNG